jgi:hypothetical protein
MSYRAEIQTYRHAVSIYQLYKSLLNKRNDRAPPLPLTISKDVFVINECGVCLSDLFESSLRLPQDGMKEESEKFLENDGKSESKFQMIL